MLTASDAATLCHLFTERHIQFWVMGGWGVDALFHTETRPHKDLDILVAWSDLPNLWRVLTEQNFTLQYVWQENRWVEDGSERWPTAFVMADSAGRELDVHVIALGSDGAVTQLYTVHWPLPIAFTGAGSIAGQTVPCVSQETQLAMHTGYDLPENHRKDLTRLQAAD